MDARSMIVKRADENTTSRAGGALKLIFANLFGADSGLGDLYADAVETLFDGDRAG